MNECQKQYKLLVKEPRDEAIALSATKSFASVTASITSLTGGDGMTLKVGGTHKFHP